MYLRFIDHSKRGADINVILFQGVKNFYAVVYRIHHHTYAINGFTNPLQPIVPLTRVNLNNK